MNPAEWDAGYQSDPVWAEPKKIKADRPTLATIRFLEESPGIHPPFAATFERKLRYECKRGKWWQRLLRRQCPACTLMGHL